MNSFSIICKSCASRLKVTKLSAIGQTLGCPKCGTMVQVRPPADWVPPDGFTVPDMGPVDLNSFEDIDQLLDQSTTTETPAVPVPKPAVPRPRTASRPQSQPPQGNQRAQRGSNQPPAPVSAEGSKPPPQSGPDRLPAEASAPVLPGDEWTSAQSKKRKQLILMVAGAVGSVVVVAAIITAIVVNANKPVAKGPDEAGADPLGAKQTDDADPNGRQDQLGGVDGENGKSDSEQNSNPSDGAKEPDGVKEPEIGEGKTGLLDDTPTGIGEIAQSVDSTNDKAPSIDPTMAQPPSVGIQDPVAKPPVVSPGSVPTIGTEPPTVGSLDPKPAVTMPGSDPQKVEDDPQEQLGDLASLLEFSDSSLLDLQEVASSFQANATNRQTKYYVEKPKPSKLDPQRQLALPVDRIEYAGKVPFSRVVRTASKLAGLPITIDARQLELMGKPVDPSIMPTIEETTIEGMLQQIGNDRGLSVLTTDHGFVLTLPNATEMSEAKIDFPNVPGIEEAEKQRFIGAIKTMIAPAAWLREENPATIELVDNQLAVKCALETQQSIRLFVDKLDAAVKLLDAPDDESVWKNVRSRWTLTEDIRNEDPKLKVGKTRQIGELLNHIKSETGLTVIVDWEQAARQGWTPMTMLPGLLDEDTVDELIHELALAMNLSAIAINSETIMLTTVQAAPFYIDLEVYPVSKELDQQVVGSTLQELVVSSLGRQVMENKVLVIYEKRCRCLIVVAPQSIQRQVEALLKRIDPVF